MISFSTFAIAMTYFSGLLLLQNLGWRLAAACRLKMRREFLILLVLFVGGSASGIYFTSEPAPFLLSLSFSVVYVMVFGCASVKSPSLEIVRLVYEAGNEGVEMADLKRRLAQPSLLGDRMRNLGQAGLWREGKSTLLGRGVAAFFYYFRRSLGQALGSG